jgi:hypothetical protein
VFDDGARPFIGQGHAHLFFDAGHVFHRLCDANSAFDLFDERRRIVGDIATLRILRRVPEAMAAAQPVDLAAGGGDVADWLPIGGIGKDGQHIVASRQPEADDARPGGRDQP